MSDPNSSTSTGDGVSLSSTFLEFCAKVRKDDPSILPKYPDEPFLEFCAKVRKDDPSILPEYPDEP
jgi:hypothetical protein